MAQIVSITSQGQISIPAKIRRELGLDEYRKAVVRRNGGQIVIEPVEDILKLGGSLQKYGLKGKSISQIRRLEKQAAVEGFSRNTK